MTSDQERDTDEKSAAAEPQSVPLGEFIETNSGLFLVMAAFAGFAVYISTLSTSGVSEQTIQFGLVSSLVIAAIIWMLIFIRLTNWLSRDGDGLTNLSHYENIDIGLFLIVFIGLISSLVEIILEEVEAVSVIIYIGIISGSLIGGFTMIRYVSSSLTTRIQTSDIRISLSGSVVSGGAYLGTSLLINWIEENYQMVTLNDVSNAAGFSDIFPSLLRQGLLTMQPMFRLGCGVFGLLFVAVVLRESIERFHEFKEDWGL